MNVLIIEDEAPAFRRLQRILEELEMGIQILEVIDTVEDSIKWLRTNKELDLIFMDIQLADGLSFEIFKEVEVETPVIFTTAYNEYTLEAFKVNSIDYLLKPIDEKLLKKSIEKYKKYHQSDLKSNVDLNAILEKIKPESKNYKDRFLVKSLQKLISIATDDIAYFYTESGVLYLKTKEGKKYSIDFTLEELESKLDPQYFSRLNRQFIGNISAIQSCESYEKGKLMVVLEPRTDLPVIVSRERGTDFKKWLGMG